jgi:hypothetical protein
MCDKSGTLKAKINLDTVAAKFDTSLAGLVLLLQRINRERDWDRARHTGGMGGLVASLSLQSLGAEFDRLYHGGIGRTQVGLMVDSHNKKPQRF